MVLQKNCVLHQLAVLLYCVSDNDLTKSCWILIDIDDASGHDQHAATGKRASSLSHLLKTGKDRSKFLIVDECDSFF